jgi:uncharacterized membrane protein
LNNINREDIQILSRNSNWQEADVATILSGKIYNNKENWQKFLQLFFISLGVSFTIAGVLFFFAYNWDDLHKFVKLGLVEGLIIILTLVAVFTKIKPLFKNIILSGATMLVGVLFAVFGQIYQTGANAYDFFLGWTMAVALWVFVANFSVLWLIFIVLINVTFGLYLEQVAPDWNDLFIFSIFIGLNAFFLITSLFLKSQKFSIPNWFTNLLALGVVIFVTFAMYNGIFDSDKSYLGLVLILGIVLYVSGIYYGLQNKRSFYLSIIPFSIIMIIAGILAKEISFREFEMFLVIGFFIVGSVTLVIKMLMNLQKKWKADNTRELRNED